MSIKSRIENGKCLKSLSTFGIGGKARYFIAVHTIQEMQQVILFIKKNNIPFWVIGRGSNILFDDRGFNGLIILNKIVFMRCEKGWVDVGAGYSFALLGTKMTKKDWGGLEFAACIPGSVGGAIYMNAGAHGYATKDTLQSVAYIDMRGKIIQKKAEELLFSYRSSLFKKIGGVIVSGQFALKKDEGAIQRQMEMISYRKNTQPYKEQSAGCIFRNPCDISAGLLIERCGLRGMQIGGAKVSTKHGNFIINTGRATAQDVLYLMMLVRKIIKDKTGHSLKTEVCFVPYSLHTVA